MTKLSGRTTKTGTKPNVRYGMGGKDIIDLRCRGAKCPMTNACGRHRTGAFNECHGKRRDDGLWECQEFAYAYEIPMDKVAD